MFQSFSACKLDQFIVNFLKGVRKATSVVEVIIFLLILDLTEFPFVFASYLSFVLVLEVTVLNGVILNVKSDFLGKVVVPIQVRVIFEKVYI